MAKSKLLAMGAAGVLGAAALLPGTAQAEYDALTPTYSGTNLYKAVTGGDIYLAFRPRYEYVNDSAGNLKDANAFTLRSVLGYQTGRFYGLGLYWKILDVRHLGGKAFNEPFTNPNPGYATVADPATLQTQEGYISYQLPANLYPQGPAALKYLAPAELKYGRQVITLQNHRFIGNVVWRQVWLTYDGGSVNYALPYGGHLFYAHLNGANTPASVKAGDAGRINMQTEIINLEFDLEHWLGAPTTLAGYGYLLNFDRNDAVPALGSSPGLTGQDSSTASNKTLGVRLSGEIPFAANKGAPSLLYLGEYAHQSDYGNGDSVIDADYIYGMLGLGAYGIKLTANYEILGSNNGQYAVQTPFATAFAMNGWADRIPGNRAPGIGLVDAWIQADAASPASWGPVLSGLKLSARYHDFSSDQGSTHYGQEFDVRVSKALAPNITAYVQYAGYWGDSEAASVAGASNLDQDLQKVMVWARLFY